MFDEGVTSSCWLYEDPVARCWCNPYQGLVRDLTHSDQSIWHYLGKYISPEALLFAFDM